MLNVPCEPLDIMLKSSKWGRETARDLLLVLRKKKPHPRRVLMTSGCIPGGGRLSRIVRRKYFITRGRRNIDTMNEGGRLHKEYSREVYIEKRLSQEREGR